jgi:hypothetical protein
MIRLRILIELSDVIVRSFIFLIEIQLLLLSFSSEIIFDRYNCKNEIKKIANKFRMPDCNIVLI